jgi:hypothetical protein
MGKVETSMAWKVWPFNGSKSIQIIEVLQARVLVTVAFILHTTRDNGYSQENPVLVSCVKCIYSFF